MTRYKQRTRRAVIAFLQESGPSTLYEIADALGQEVRVTRNYLQHFRSDFRVTGHAAGARWSTTVRETQRGYDTAHKTR